MKKIDKKMKRICDFVEDVAKDEGMDLLGLLWYKEENRGLVLCNLPNEDEQINIMVSALIAMVIRSKPAEDIRSEVNRLIIDAIHLAGRVNFPEDKNEDD